MTEFKKLSEVEVVVTPADTANVLIEEDGVIKKVTKDAVGGGGTSFKTFTLTLGQGATLKLTDMGSNLVHVNFVFKGAVKNKGEFEYQIPTDNPEYVAWATEKIFMFAPSVLYSVDVSTEGGTYPTYAIAEILCVNTTEESINSFNLLVYGVGETQEVNNVSLDATVTALRMSDFQ